MRPYIYFSILFISIYFLIFSFKRPFVTFYYFLTIFPLIFGFSSLPGFEKLPLVRVINVIFFITILFNMFISKNKLIFPYKNIKISLFCFIFFGIFSSLLSKYPIESLFRLFTYLEPLFWFVISYYSFYYWGNIELVKKFFLFLNLGIILFLIFGIIEYFYQSNILINYGILIKSDVDYLSEIRFFESGRLSSTLGQPVYASLFALTGIGIVNFSKRIFYKYSILLNILIILIILFILLSGTRTSIVGLIIFLIFYFYFNYKLSYKFFIYLLIFLLFSYLITFILFEELAVYLIESFNISNYYYTKENTNFLFRIDLTLNFLKLAFDNFFIGIGPGVIQKSFFIFGDYTFYGFTGIENQFATLLLENGILGLIAFSLFLFFMIRELTIAKSNFYKNNDNYFYFLTINVISIFITLLILSFTVYITNSIIFFYLFLLIGMILGYFNNQTNAKNRNN